MSQRKQWCACLFFILVIVMACLPDIIFHFEYQRLSSFEGSIDYPVIISRIVFIELAIVMTQSFLLKYIFKKDRL